MIYDRIHHSQIGVDFIMLYVMIEALHIPLHTHSRSSLYICNAIQHLLLWLQVIRMLPHPDIYSLWPESGCRGCRRWTLSWYLWLRPHIPFILIAGLLYTYVMQFSTFNRGYGSYGCCHTLIFTLYDLRVDVVGAEGGLSVGTYD
jgi:hypothetical protein